MFKYKIYCLLALLCYGISASAQNVEEQPLTPEQLEFLKTKENRYFLANPSWLSYTALPDFMEVNAFGNITDGDFRLTMEPEKATLLGMHTQGKRTVKKITFLGDFGFTTNSEKSLMYTHSMSPYGSNPYYMCDSIGGDWSKLGFSMNGIIAYKPSEKLSVGIGLNYEVMDGSKTIDPRPRVFHSNIELNPSLSWKMSASQLLAVDVRYGYNRDRTDIELVGSETHNLYSRKGLAFFDRETFSTKAIFSNSYTSRNLYQVGLSYQLTLGKLMWTTRVECGMEDNLTDWGDNQQRKVGYYDAKRYGFNTSLLVAGSVLTHVATINGMYREGIGTEVFQEPKNGKFMNWSTIFEDERYESQDYTLGLSYDLFKNRTAVSYSWNVGLDAGLTQWEQTYVPALTEAATKNRIASMLVRINKPFELGKGHKLVPAVAAGGIFPITNSLKLSDFYSIKEYSFIANSIVNPDFAYYSSKAFQYAAGVQYSFPLVKNRFNGYVKADFKGHRNMESSSSLSSARYYYGLTVGIMGK